MNNDTISLLQECSAGANMAMSAIDQVLEGVEDPALRDALTESRRVHDRIGGETRSLLRAQGQEGKAANPVAQSMAWLKTNWKLTVRPGDETVADLIVDGCNMGAHIRAELFVEPELLLRLAHEFIARCAAHMTQVREHSACYLHEPFIGLEPPVWVVFHVLTNRHTVHVG